MDEDSSYEDSYDGDDFEMEEIDVEEFLPTSETIRLKQTTDSDDSDDLNLEGLDDGDMEDNDGQTLLITLLNQIDKRTSELIINNTLSGVIDLGILTDRGFDCIKKIVFSKKGRITELLNLPKDLVVLECPEQRIRSLGGMVGGMGGKMPPRLEELICYDNQLEELDLANMPRLFRLNANNNRLNSLHNVPSSLRELFVNDNRLEKLDLVDAVQLQVLHISNNSGHLVIHHLPSASLVDFKSENTHLSSFLKADMAEAAVADQEPTQSKNIRYEDALEIYHEMKERHHNRAGKCPKCEQKGGVIFSQGKNRLYARCGNVNPCSLKIQLYRGVFRNRQKHKEEFEQVLKNIKEEIIRINLDTVFAFSSENQAMERYRRSKEELTLVSAELEKINRTDKEQEVVREQARIDTQRQIDAIQKMIKTERIEYNKQKEPNRLEQIVELQTRQLQPLYEKLRQIRYDATEVSQHVPKTSGFKREIRDVVSRLNHYESGMYVEDISLGEKPAVLQFIV